ncbi:MAG TPA: serine hydrolase [Bacteroidota bacterium]|nr:serine hydrolase [Bacteroidota bacterium]
MNSHRFIGTMMVVAVLAPTLGAQQAPVPGLEQYVVRAMHDWETPGLAIAIVRDSTVVYSKGFGVRKMGQSAPVTTKTIFACASTTKAMTAACLGMLVDEGKISWDDRVIDRLPGFQLFDPYAMQQMTIRDLLTHRSGLDRGDLLWYLSPYDRSEVLRRIKFLRPAWSFRSHYGYQNVMYLAAGELVESVSGESWDAFIAERLFAPLGMNSTSTSTSKLAAFDDVATPHDEVDGTMQPIRWPNFDNIGGAGTVNSNVEDYARWIELNLGGGMFEGRKILSAGVIKEMQTPQTIIPLDSVTNALWPSMHFAAYGFGWTLRDYLGRKLIQHDGALDGMRARVVLVPEEKLGFVILMNSSRTGLHTAIAYRILDYYLGAPERDWSTILLTQQNQQDEREKAAEKRKLDSRVPGTKPSAGPEKIVGTYDHELYGPATISQEGGGLVLGFYPAYVGEMIHWHFDTYQVIWRDRTLGKDYITFTFDSDGKVIAFQWDGVGEFKRKEKP